MQTEKADAASGAFAGKRGGLRFYHLSIMPISIDGQMEKLFITCVNTTQAMRFSDRRTMCLINWEKEALPDAAQGRPNKAMAHQMLISEGAVKRVVSAYTKTAYPVSQVSWFNIV